MEKFFSEACERNKEPIFKVLRQVIGPHNRRLFEIGSGTAQHAIFLAPFFPHVEWTCSERKSAVDSMNRNIKAAGVANIRPSFTFDAGKDEFPRLHADLIFTANTFHIMHWKECKSLIKLLGNRLQKNAKVMIYGPFNYEGKFTSPSNEEFDQWLKNRDPLSGIRAFEDVNKAMLKQGFALEKDYEMPSNNRMLVYNRLTFIPKIER